MNLNFIVGMMMKMHDLDSKKYKPIVIWNRTEHNAPFMHRSYVVVSNPFNIFENF